MKKYISVFTIMVMIFLAACSNQNTSSTPTSNENNTQSNSVTKLDEGVWPENEYTEGLPVAPGTVAWATLDTEHENCNINLTGISENDYNEYMELLNQEGFSVIENVSEEIEGENYVSIGTLLSNDEKWLSISYIPNSLTIYIRETSLYHERTSLPEISSAASPSPAKTCFSFSQQPTGGKPCSSGSADVLPSESLM